MKKDNSQETEFLPEMEDESPSKFKKFGTAIVIGFVVLAMSAFGLLEFIGVGSDYVVKVEGKKVTPQAFSRFLDSQRKQYIYRFGSGIIESFLNKRDFVIMTANSMADALLIEKALEVEGIVINKDTVNYYIVNNPMFQTVDGKFDRTFFNAYLNQMGVTEEDYIIQQVSIIGSKFLLEVLALNDILFEENLVRKLIASERQTRDLLIKRIKIVDTLKMEVNEKEVLQFYIKNKERFAEPEKKTVLIGKIDEASIGAVPVSSAEVIKEYNKQYLYKNQKVSFYKLSFSSIEEARFAQNLIKNEGLSFTEVGKETLNLKASDTYFKNISFAELSPEFSEVITGMEKFEVSPIFYANGSYNILKIDSVSKANVPSFESVKGKIISNLRRVNSCGEVEKVAERIASELDSGEAIENGLKSSALQKIVISGMEKTLLPEVLESAIFSDNDTSYGKVVKTKSCEFYAYQIKEIESQTFKTLESVQAEIIAQMKQERLMAEALAKANAEIERFQVSSFFEDEKVTVSRNDLSLVLSEDLKRIFMAYEGEILPAVLSASGKEYFIIKVAKINRFDESKIKDGEVKVALKQIKENKKDELLQGLLIALREKYSVKINYSYLQVNE